MVDMLTLFLKFIDIHDHGAESIASSVIQVIEEVGLNLQDMRVQSYDNAASMSGIYTGLQARIKALDHLAGYSLNLVVASAALGLFHFPFFCKLHITYS